MVNEHTHTPLTSSSEELQREDLARHGGNCVTFDRVSSIIRQEFSTASFMNTLIPTWCSSGAALVWIKAVLIKQECWPIIASAIHKLKIVQLSAALVHTGDFMKGVVVSLSFCNHSRVVPSTEELSWPSG